MPDNDWSKYPFPPNQHLHFSPLRRIQQHKDSDGVLHDVLVQTEEMSCGLAAAAMLIDIWHHRRKSGGPDAEMRLKQIAGRFPGSMVEQDTKWKSQGPSSGHEGSQVTNIEKLLLRERIPITAVWHRWQEKANTAALALGRIHHRPALLLWGWYDASGNNRNGGHFTVAARVTKAGNVVILDPWDGSLAEISRAARYNGSGMLDAAVYTG
jgi:Papain-like cysteine protease AvrRpt2